MRADSSGTGDRPEPRVPRPWYKVVLGAMPARPSIAQLDAIFSEEVDEDRVDRKTRGNILAATALLDEWGVLVPDTLAIASFAWGLGSLIAGGKRVDLGEWESREDALVEEFSGLLSPTGPNGRPRSLTWHDLRDVSHHLCATLGLPAELWIVAPCAIRIDRKDPPSGDLLSSFFLGDLSRVERQAEALPTAAASYLGLLPPSEPWDALTDRGRLSRLLEPALFPPGRWPGPGLHPLTLLQQAAVNAVAGDLKEEGLAAVNGPPGTGKTTLLRDIVAHVVVERAKRLAEIDDPSKSIGDLDLMDYAVVVASSNNAAVENISLELPVRKKALDETIWHGAGLSYFSETATHLLKLPADAAEEEKAWGLVAARLGNSDNRYEFFQRFWYDKDWGLSEWLDRVWSPDQARYKDREPSRLTRADPPPRREQARTEWRIAKAEFGKALDHCLRLRTRLEEASRGDARLRALESALPAAHEARARLGEEQADARKAAATIEAYHRSLQAEEAAERAKLSALRDVRPVFSTVCFAPEPGRPIGIGCTTGCRRSTAFRRPSRRPDMIWKPPGRPCAAPRRPMARRAKRSSGWKASAMRCFAGSAPQAPSLGRPIPRPASGRCPMTPCRRPHPGTAALSAMPAMPCSSRPCACTAPSSSRGLPG